MIIQKRNTTLYCTYQIEHAKLASFILKHIPGFNNLNNSIKNELLIATLHHDDGWKNYDNNLAKQKKLNLYENFTEISTQDHIQILTHSRKAISKESYLAKYLVCSHNIYLATLRLETTLEFNEKRNISTFIKNEIKEKDKQLIHLQSITQPLLKKCVSLLKLADWFSLCTCLKNMFPSTQEQILLDFNNYPTIKCQPKLINSPINYEINQTKVYLETNTLEKKSLKLTFN